MDWLLIARRLEPNMSCILRTSTSTKLQKKLKLMRNSAIQRLMYLVTLKMLQNIYKKESMINTGQTYLVTYPVTGICCVVYLVILTSPFCFLF